MNIPKFRAYVSDQNYMGDVSYINFVDKELSFGVSEHQDELLFDFKDCILMQSTGLTDKNGIDIFDGDIVRWDDMSKGKHWRVAAVERKADVRFKIIRIKCDFEQSAREGYIFKIGTFSYADTHNHLEILGNIHQNRDLLNV